MRSLDEAVEINLGQIWKITHNDKIFLAEVIGFENHECVILLVPHEIRCSLYYGTVILPQCKILQHKIGVFDKSFFREGQLISTEGW